MPRLRRSPTTLLALRLADEASALALDLLVSGPHSSRKVDGTVVTNADIAVERMLSAHIALETARK
jgi:fructose-1,6-bisphosphatase/inositol monophosphatase family enzyme